MNTMQSKLTLRLDPKLIERAKAYANSTGRTVSQLVSQYFAMLGVDASPDGDVHPLVRSLHGRLFETSFDEPDYAEHVDAKYGRSRS